MDFLHIYIFVIVHILADYVTVTKACGEDNDLKNCEIDYCSISIPNKVFSKFCRKERTNDVNKARLWYTITENGKINLSPKQYTYLPLLNQTKTDVALKAMTDPLESRWITMTQLFSSMVIAPTSTHLIEQLGRKMYLTYNDFKLITKTFQLSVEKMNRTEYFGNPTMFDDFFDVINSNRYLSDKVFTERFLAGTCPFLLQKVTMSGKTGMKYSSLHKLLNTNKYDFDKLISNAYGDDKEKGKKKGKKRRKSKRLTLYQAVRRGQLYVYYEKDSNDLMNQVDAEHLSVHGRRMFPSTSPIVLFVRDQKNVLKVAAIQVNYKCDSDVYSPQSHALDWLIAKGRTETAYFSICQVKYHLGHMHFLSPTLFCIVFRRHLGSKHPLYSILKYHCEGSVPQIMLSADSLDHPSSPFVVSLGIGAQGAEHMIRKAHEENFYGVLSFDKWMKRRGLYKDKLSYYPFRDDGKLIWNALKKFSWDVVNAYYKSNKQVEQDWELQGFVNEISNDQKLFGFPNKFKKKSDVSLFLTRLIWNIILHSTVNYATNPYMTFLPFFPSKMYNETRFNLKENYVNYLPSGYASILYSALTTTMSNFRINRIFDYHDRLEVGTLKRIVQYHHTKMHTQIQNVLKKRNAERKKKKHLTFQYIEPKWQTNSIHA